MDLSTATLLQRLSVEDRHWPTHYKQQDAEAQEVIYSTSTAPLSKEKMRFSPHLQHERFEWLTSATANERPSSGPAFPTYYPTNACGLLAYCIPRPSINFDESLLRINAPNGIRMDRLLQFNLAKRIEHKEGVPISFLLNETLSTLAKIIENPYKQIPVHSSKGGTSYITLRIRVSTSIFVEGDGLTTLI